MNLRIHLIHNSAAAALLHFLKTAIEFQEQCSTVIDTAESNKDFFDLYGYTKEDLEEAVKALKEALK